MQWLLWCFCLLAESYETINHCHWSSPLFWFIIVFSDGVSRLVLGLETHFCESRPRFQRFQVTSQFWSRRLQVSRLWISQRNGIVKFLWFNDFCLFNLQVRNNQNKSEKCQKFEKKYKLEVMMTFLKNISKKCKNFEVLCLGLEFQVSVSGFLMKSRSRSRSQCCHSQGKIPKLGIFRLL